MRKSRFEGWYFKQNTCSGDYAIAFIPGRATDAEGNSHAFIQLNQSAIPHSYYITFPIEEFKIANDPLVIEVGGNRFSKDGFTVHIDTDQISVSADIKFHNVVDISRSFMAPGIMGAFGYLPFLECYHEVYSLNHTTSGQITLNGESHDFDNGMGYIEGDRGASFPKNWIWMQTNNFANATDDQDQNQNQVSLMCAIAKVPVLPSGKFPIQGLICVFYLNGKEYRFATYNRARIVRINSGIHSLKDTVEIEMRRGDLALKIFASGERGGRLASPKQGAMVGIIKENIDAQIEVELWKGKNLIYKGTGINGGFEKNW